MSRLAGKPKPRPPRRGLIGADNDVDFEETWKTISSSLREMHTKNASKLSFETIYRLAYRVVLKKKGDTFYKRILQFERDWLGAEVRADLQTLLVPSLVGSSEASGGTASTINERRSAGERLLRGLKEAWEDHQLVMNMATDVFMYLDRVYCTDSRVPSVYTASMLLFRDCILRAPLAPTSANFLDILNTIILDQIAMERDGDIIDKSLIRSCIYMLEGLYETADEREEDRLYLTSFEDKFLQSSQVFYHDEAAKLIGIADAATYCKRTRKRINEEQDRCLSTLSAATSTKITSVVENELIRNKIGQIIAMESGVKHMVDNDRFEDLELVFELNSRIDPKKLELTTAIQRRVQEVGASINDAAVAAASAPPAPAAAPPSKEKSEGDGKPAAGGATNQQTLAALQWVDSILALKEKYDRLWRESFQSDPLIQPALTRSFTETINVFPRSSEFISLFIDENMKKGLKDKTEAEIDAVLERAIVLLRYVQDKDMFERYYKKHLCKRLLMGRSVSVEVEKQMISRMKIELGNTFTSKLENMFKDMALSEELTAGYRARVAGTGQAKRVELGMHVLTSMTWPLETMDSASGGGGGNEAEQHSRCIYPPVIDRLRKGFENFYAERHSGRVLTWMANMGTADVRAVFPAVAGKDGAAGKERRHELNVSTYAMMILLLFNSVPAGGSLGFEEIQARTGICTSDLARNLQSLAVAAKTRVLVKEPMSKEVRASDRFRVNEGFVSKFLRLKVGVVAAGNRVEGDKERLETEKKNDRSRGFVIEAGVVRIMKQRKTLTHQQLVSETLSVLASQFKPDVNMIKQRIEALIDREYLERVDESEVPAYRYLA